MPSGNRYDRQKLLPEVGVDGQQRLADAHVAIIGMGGLGSLIAPYLSGAGIGKLTICDFDRVELTNLQRQTIYKESEIGRYKVEAAGSYLRSFNSETEIREVKARVTARNIEPIISSAHVVVDGTDNLGSRYVINDACYFMDKPMVYGSVFRFMGLVSVFYGSPCYRCLFPDSVQAPTCSEAGVLGVVPGTIAMLQATEVLKLILKNGDTLEGKLLRYDALKTFFGKSELPSDPECQLCSSNAEIKTLQDSYMVATLDVVELEERLGKDGDFHLIDVREPEEFEEGFINGAVLMPLGELGKKLEEQDVPKDAEVILYCKAGGRSERALLAMEDMGYTNLVHLEGGITAWKERNG